jgi:hypothetical protein
MINRHSLMLVALAAVGCGHPSDLVGRWSNGTTTYTFNADGSYTRDRPPVQNLPTRESGTYKVNGTTLTLDATDLGYRTIGSWPFYVGGDRFTRAAYTAKAAHQGLVGTWTYGGEDDITTLATGEMYKLTGHTVMDFAADKTVTEADTAAWPSSSSQSESGTWTFDQASGAVTIQGRNLTPQWTLLDDQVLTPNEGLYQRQ